MSVSTLRGDVDRLAKDVADLERKAADESARAIKDHGQALRVADHVPYHERQHAAVEGA